MAKKEAQVGEVKRQVTYDYILELYEEIKDKPDITDKEREDQFAVLKVLADHIGEYMVIKYKQTKNNKGETINE
mgnify:CR=1 FL=1